MFVRGKTTGKVPACVIRIEKTITCDESLAVFIYQLMLQILRLVEWENGNFVGVEDSAPHEFMCDEQP